MSSILLDCLIILTPAESKFRIWNLGILWVGFGMFLLFNIHPISPFHCSLIPCVFAMMQRHVNTDMKCWHTANPKNHRWPISLTHHGFSVEVFMLLVHLWEYAWRPFLWGQYPYKFYTWKNRVLFMVSLASYAWCKSIWIIFHFF